MIKADFEVHTSDDGSFTINVDGKTWLHSADTYFRVGKNTYSTGNKTLPMMGKPTSSAGIDGIGPYNMVNYSYEANVRRVDALVKTYQNGNVTVFSQVWHLHFIAIASFGILHYEEMRECKVQLYTGIKLLM